MTHPLDIINKRLSDGYYRNLPPYSYSKDVADILYCDGRMTKEEYDLIRSKYEFYSDKDEKERENPGIYNTVYKK